MDEINDDIVNDTNLCKLCEKEISKYLCPRCGVKYCSSSCYKSEIHSECSESFYKQCVEEELKTNEEDPETRRKILEILKRIHDEQENDINDTEELAQHGLDSDDDDEVPELSERLKNVDLDDADSVWAALTDSERQEFEASLRNGEMEKMISTWKPWWSYHAETKLVEDLSNTNVAFDYLSKCPRIKKITPFNQISKVPPAECVRNNLLNVLHAYVFTTFYFNGDHHNFVREATYILLQLCNNLRDNQVFLEADLAVESVSQQAINCQSIVADSENISATKNACISILQGPEDSNKCFYLKAALSDVHELLTKAKLLDRQKNPSNSKNNEFAQRFLDHPTIPTTEITREKLRLYSKKIEYYLSWVESYGTRYLYA